MWSALCGKRTIPSARAWRSPTTLLGELSLEVNMLADLLAEHRIGAIEATALLQRVVEEVDIPLFAFDPSEALRLVNSAGERLLQQASPRLLGQNGHGAGLENMPLRRECLGDSVCTSTATRAGSCGEVHFGSGECRTPWWCFPT